jgi:hypothetical protein
MITHTKTFSTLRAPVLLPPLPTDRDAARKFAPIAMARARLAHGNLVFDEDAGFYRALEDGFFLLEIPQELTLSGGDQFVRHFFEPRTSGDLAPYTGYKNCKVPGAYQGYFDREHDQWENFYIEKCNWHLLPHDVAQLGHAMAQVGIQVLRSTLAQLGLPQTDWATVTGGLTEQGGHQMLAFNHFRSDKPSRGSKIHRDTGWVTVLRSTEPGLFAYIGGEFRAVNPEPGYFIVNFGSSIEVLTQALPTPVRASIHGIAQTIRDAGELNRVSYVIFLDSDLDGDIYCYGPDGPEKVQTVEQFAIQEVSRTYDDSESTL